MTGTVESTKPGHAFEINNAAESTDSYYVATRTDTDVSVAMGVGAGGANHGLYSRTLGKWLVHGHTNGNVYLGGNVVADVVVAQGTSGIWTYRKWSSGIAECWGTHTYNSTFPNAYTGYESSQKTATLPSGLFKSINSVQVSLKTANGAWAENACAPDTSKITYIAVNQLKQTSAIGVEAKYSVKGKWK